MLPTPADPGHPSRARFTVLAFFCTLMFVLYLDRVCIAQASVPMMDELGISKLHWSFVLMAFTLAYGLFEVPTGRWGDLYGARRILTRIVLWWSAFTALTAASPLMAPLVPPALLDAVAPWFGAIPAVLLPLILMRFLFGAGEAGAVPNVARAVPRWFPAGERGRVQGLVMAFMAVGAASAPVLAQRIIAVAGWRGAFVAFALVGVVWAAAFWWWFRDQPAEHPSVNAGELRKIAESGPPPPEASHDALLPWGEALTNPSVLLLAGTTICLSFTSYVFYSWYPTYLQKGRGVDADTASVLASIVLIGGGLGTFTGGVLSDLIARRRRDQTRARRRLGFLAFALAAVLLVSGTFAHSALVSVLLTALAFLTAMSQQANWWTCVTQVSGRHIGALFGLLNSASVLGAMPSQFFFGWFSDYRGGLGYTGRAQWDPAFYVCTALLVIGSVFWLAVDPTRTIDAGEPRAKEKEAAVAAGST
jgi:ACS family glucarate transporter-like MFS transporter